MNSAQDQNLETRWENHERHVPIIAIPVSIDSNPEKGLGLEAISIRLQKKLICELKVLAKAEGIGYQPYIRQFLTHHVRTKKKRINR